MAVTNRSGKAKEMPWTQIKAAPIVVVRSSEPIIAERAVARLRAQVLQADRETECHEVGAAEYEAGTLANLTAASLFQQPRFVVINAMERAPEPLAEELMRYLQDPEPDVVLVLRFDAASRRKKLMDALGTCGAGQYVVPQMKRAGDRVNLIRSDVREQGREIEPDAVNALVEAVSDLAELVALARQLLSDVEGTITREDVDRYRAGRIESDVFAIADAAIAGNAARALTLLRHGLASGVKPIPLHGAIASKVRMIAKVMADRPPSAREIGIQEWQWRQARQNARRWNSERMKVIIEELAHCEADLKGQSKAPIYALERLIQTIAS